MYSVGLRVIGLFAFLCFCLLRLGFSQSIPEPKAKVHCSYDGNWYSPEEYHMYCKPPQQTFQTVPKPYTGLSPSQQMQLQMFQSMFQPIFNSLFNFNAFFLPPNTSHQSTDYQKAKLEEQKKKALEAWQKYLEEAERQAKLEVESRKAAGQDILSKARIGSGPLGSYTIIGPKGQEGEAPLSHIDWSNPRPNSVPFSNAQVASEKAKEQLLRAVYFSKMAETAMLSGDLEAARFWAGVAFEGESISPRAIDYRPPKEVLEAMDSQKTAELNRKLSQYSRFFKEALPKLDMLKDLLTKTEEINTKKEEAQKKIKDLEAQIRDLELKNQKAQTPEEKSQTSNLLARAISLKQEAEVELQKAIKEEQKLTQERQDIEKELNKLKNAINLN